MYIDCVIKFERYYIVFKSRLFISFYINLIDFGFFYEC